MRWATELTVLMDGGVRSGLDVLKALSLGAKACLIGRAWAWSLGAGGEAGVARMLTILRQGTADGDVAHRLRRCGRRRARICLAGHPVTALDTGSRVDPGGLPRRLRSRRTRSARRESSLSRMAGDWYILATLPNGFERGIVAPA